MTKRTNIRRTVAPVSPSTPSATVEDLSRKTVQAAERRTSVEEIIPEGETTEDASAESSKLGHGGDSEEQPIRYRVRWASIPDEDTTMGDAYERETARGESVERSIESEKCVGGHYIMDRGEIIAALNASGFDGSFDAMSSGEEARARTLVRYRDMPLFRRHVVGSHDMLARLDELDRSAPNFARVTKLVRRAAHLSMISGAPLKVQPQVIVGPAGCGKSRYARLLANALCTSCDVINGSTIPDVGSLVGYPPVWRGSGPGRIAKFLISSRTSGPLLFVDESEKIADETMRNPLDRLLTLLEPSTAAGFQDECIQVRMRVEHAVFLFACNTLDAFSEPFLDRTVVHPVKELPPAVRDAALEAMLAEVAQALGVAISLANPEVLTPIRSLGLRRSRMALELAIGRACERNRRFLVAEDLVEAVSLLGPPKRMQIGFVQHEVGQG